MFLQGWTSTLTQFNRYRKPEPGLRRPHLLDPTGGGHPSSSSEMGFFLGRRPFLIASMLPPIPWWRTGWTSRLGISRNPAVTTAVGGTILTDTVALLVLAVGGPLGPGGVGSPPIWLTLGSLFTLYVAGSDSSPPPAGPLVFRNVQDGAPAEFAFILATVFLCSWLRRPSDRGHHRRLPGKD